MRPDTIASEKEWQARDDARTLAYAQEIADDPTRLQAAKAAARKMVDESTEETANLRKVAGKQPGRKPYTEPSGRAGETKGKVPKGIAELPINFLNK
jgi:hypothetical protein